MRPEEICIGRYHDESGRDYAYTKLGRESAQLDSRTKLPHKMCDGFDLLVVHPIDVSPGPHHLRFPLILGGFNYYFVVQELFGILNYDK